MLRGTVSVDEVDGVAPEYRSAAVRYFGEEQGTAWCDQFPEDSHDALHAPAGLGWPPRLRRHAPPAERYRRLTRLRASCRPPLRKIVIPVT